jgi:hypothetical protein
MEWNACNCGQSFWERVRRKFWMRLLPGSKYYRCKHCEKKFLLTRTADIRARIERTSKH